VNGADERARVSRRRESEAAESRHRIEVERAELEGQLLRTRERLEVEWGRPCVGAAAAAGAATAWFSRSVGSSVSRFSPGARPCPAHPGRWPCRERHSARKQKTSMRTLLRRSVPLVLLAASAACDSSSGPESVASLSISPVTSAVRVGNTQPLTVTVTGESGTALTGRVVTWASANIALALVDAQGVVTGVAPGTVAITATSEGKTAATVVEVLPQKVAAIDVFLPTSRATIVGDTMRLQAVARDSLGRSLPDRPITYTSSNEAVATVSPTGLLSYLAPGTAVITARAETRSASVAVTVANVYTSFGRSAWPCGGVSVGATCAATATLRFFQPDNAVPGSSDGYYKIVVTSSDPSVAKVTQTSATGATITGVSPGTAYITATYVGANGVTRTNAGTYPVTVTP